MVPNGGVLNPASSVAVYFSGAATAVSLDDFALRLRVTLAGWRRTIQA